MGLGCALLGASEARLRVVDGIGRQQSATVSTLSVQALKLLLTCYVHGRLTTWHVGEMQCRYLFVWPSAVDGRNTTEIRQDMPVSAGVRFYKDVWHQALSAARFA